MIKILLCLCTIVVTMLSSFTTFGMSRSYAEEINECKFSLIEQVRSAIEDKLTKVKSPQHLRLCIRDVLNFFESVMKHEEDRLYQELESSFGIKKEDLLRRFQARRALRDVNEKLHIARSVPVSVEKRVRRKLENDFNMEGLELRSDRKADVASYKENVITLHQEFHTYDREAQDAIIGHETAHAFFDDPLFMTILEDMLREKFNDGTQQEINNAKAFVKKWNRFVELRADIKTSSISRMYAKGVELAARTLKLDRGEGPIYYPATSDREQIARNTQHLHHITNAYNINYVLSRQLDTCLHVSNTNN